MLELLFYRVFIWFVFNASGVEEPKHSSSGEAKPGEQPRLLHLIVVPA
jgi:hypothetical protein